METIEWAKQHEETKKPQSVNYRELLRSLSAHDDQWWQKCYINEAGLLQSDDPIVQQCLEPTEDFYCAAISAIATQLKPSSSTKMQ